MKKSGALAGVRVLDLSRVLAGPSVTQQLADFGAEVIKVERPVQGDESRRQGVRPIPQGDGDNLEDSSGFTAVNRGKKSIAIDMSTAEGQSIVRELARKCDVVVENFKTGGLRRYGLDYESLRAVNPKLVYCSITGFGQTGPHAELPGYDLIFQAMTGVISSIGTGAGANKPQRVGFPVSDITAGMTATIAVLAALYHVQAGGEGQHIDVSLYDSQVAAMTVTAANYLLAGEVPQLTGVDSNVSCPYQAFECADAQLVVAVNNSGQFTGMCRALGLDEMADDPRYATAELRLQHKAALIPPLAEAMRQLPVEECIERFTEHGVPCGKINDIGQALESEQSRQREMTRVIEHPVKGGTRVVSNPIKFSGTPVQYTLAPPMLGEHTVEILEELLDLEGARIEELAAAGAIGLPTGSEERTTPNDQEGTRR